MSVFCRIQVGTATDCGRNFVSRELPLHVFSFQRTSQTRRGPFRGLLVRLFGLLTRAPKAPSVRRAY
jgi:hypothetical protein